MKVVITGGHFSPAYSVIEELQKIHADITIIGRKYPFEGDTKSFSYEYNVSKERDIPFIELSTGRFQRKLSAQSISSLLKVPFGVLHAVQALKKVDPDVVLTFGGYIALPVAVAARMLGIPVITHEQTQGLGLSNSLISKFADVVCISFADSKERTAHARTVVTGNPIRKNIFEVVDRIEHPQKLPVLYITGGSTGSHAINTVVGDALPRLLQKYVIIHQTGDNEFDDYGKMKKIQNQLPNEFQKRYIVQKFVYPTQIGYVYKTADVVIGRSGVNTILELIACNKPSILIPLPHGQTGEQMQNAQLIQKLGLGKIIIQDNFTVDTLSETVNEILDEIEKYQVSQSIIDKYIIADSAKRIVHELTAQYEKKKN